MYYITYENILSKLFCRYLKSTFQLVKSCEIVHFTSWVLFPWGSGQVVHKPSGYWGEKLKVKGEYKPSKGGADPICIVAHTFKWTLINMKWPVHMRYSFRINVLCCHCLTLNDSNWFCTGSYTKIVNLEKREHCICTNKYPSQLTAAARLPYLQ